MKSLKIDKKYQSLPILSFYLYSYKLNDKFKINITSYL